MALIKCKECNQQISSLAMACPSCGCPIKGINKVNKSAIRKGLIIIFIPFILGIFLYLTNTRPSSTNNIIESESSTTFEEHAAELLAAKQTQIAAKEAQEALINRSCKNNYKVCNDNADLINNYGKMYLARAACQRIVDSNVKYGDGADWSFLFPFDGYFGGDDFPKTGEIMISDDKLKIKNEFGTFAKASARCSYNLASSKVTMVILDKEIIYTDISAEPLTYKDLDYVANTNEKVKTAIDKLSSVWFRQDFQYGADKMRVVFIKSQSINESGELNDTFYASGVEISAVTYMQINNAWQFVAKQKNIMNIGRWGDAPKINRAEIIKLKSDKDLFLIRQKDDYSHAGDGSEYKTLYLFSQNEWSNLGVIQTIGDTSKDCGENGLLGKCYEFIGKLSVIQSTKDYPDLLVTKTGTQLDEKGNVIKAKNSVYVFKDGNYIEQVGLEAESYANTESEQVQVKHASKNSDNVWVEIPSAGYWLNSSNSRHVFLVADNEVSTNKIMISILNTNHEICKEDGTSSDIGNNRVYKINGRSIRVHGLCINGNELEVPDSHEEKDYLVSLVSRSQKILIERDNTNELNFESADFASVRNHLEGH